MPTESDEDLRQRVVDSSSRNISINGMDLVELLDRVAAAEAQHEEIAGRMRDLMSGGVPGNGSLRSWAHAMLALVGVSCPGVTNDTGGVVVEHSKTCGDFCLHLASYGVEVRELPAPRPPQVGDGS